MFTKNITLYTNIILTQTSIFIANDLPQTPPMITPTTTLISDVDLLRCTRHIHGNISILAGSLGISSTSLQEIKRDFKEVETQAYWVLKKWQETANSSNAYQELHDKLQAIRFNNAAERYRCLYMNNKFIISLSII